MNPTARDNALALHEDIRSALRTTLELANRVHQADSDAERALPQAMKDLAYAVRKHVAAEQAELIPVLEKIDAWGPDRRVSLQKDHAKEVEAVWDVDYFPSHQQMADAVRGIARALLKALRHEESTVLDPALFGPSTVKVGEGG